MRRLERSLSRVRGRSVAELRTRGLQTARSWLERLMPSDVADEEQGLLARVAPELRAMAEQGGADALLARFRTGMDGTFLPAFDNRDATVEVLRARWPESTPPLIQHANDIRSGRFDLLGYDGLFFGSPIDWHLDPIAGRRAPVVHWSRVPYLDAGIVGDHKVVWELNRHQHFITLGRAYWATGDEAYADTIARHMLAWMDENPPKLGINWASSLEVAFRAISWVWALNFLRQSPALTPALYRRTLVFLELHGRHLESYLSTYFSPNTHLTGEALGLFVLGQCVPSLAAARRFRATGHEVLAEQIHKQIRRDGVYVEQSPYYQRYTLDFYLFALALDRSRGLRREIEPRLTVAAEHLMYLMRPDRHWPLIGDDDGGQLFPFRDRAPNDYRPTLALAAAALGRADLAACAGSVPEEVLWLMGGEGLKRFDELDVRYATPASRAFPDGGFYVMRDDWRAGSDFAVVDAGDHGFLNAGHAHADALGIEIALGGTPLFVDPGTGSYTASPATRHYYRTTAVHNTVLVDGCSSSEPGPTAFSWSTMARVDGREWLSGSQFDFFRASHDGFGRLPNPVVHERTVLFLKQRYWIVRDRIIAAGSHRIAVHFHCAPSIVATKVNATEVHFATTDGARVGHLVMADTNGEFGLTSERCSPVYGRELPTTGCTFECTAGGSRDLISIIAREPIQARREPDGSIEILTSQSRDHLFSRSDETRAGVVNDAAWTWVRRDRTTNEATELLLLDVSRCTVDGTEIVAGHPRLDYVEAQRSGEAWELRSPRSLEEVR